MRKEKQPILLLDLASGSLLTSSLGHIAFRAALPLEISPKSANRFGLPLQPCAVDAAVGVQGESRSASYPIATSGLLKLPGTMGLGSGSRR